MKRETGDIIVPPVLSLSINEDYLSPSRRNSFAKARTFSVVDAYCNVLLMALHEAV